MDCIGLQLDSPVTDLTLSVNPACNGPLSSEDVGLFNTSRYAEDAFSWVFPLSGGGGQQGEFFCQVLLKLLVAPNIVALNTKSTDHLFCSRFPACSAESSCV